MQVWKTIRIFISSTFRDMGAERDYLVRFVFPELKERCAKRRLHLIDVDLRWGVTEEEATQGKVLEVCLDEIERCRPFFVGLLGERYGWIPPKYDVPDEPHYDWLKKFDEGHSVTALEIYHGVLRDPQMKTRAFFYFRDPSFLKDTPKEKQTDFLPESEDAAEKLHTLKEEIKEKCPVFENYPCAYDGLDEKGKVKLKNLEEFGKRILEDLWAAISEEHPEDETPPDELAIERSYHEAFIENHTTRFIGRRDALNELNEFADDENENVLVVTGVAGCGKSAVLAKFAKEYSEKHQDTFVLTHFIGVSPGSTDVRRTLLRLCRELQKQFDIQEEIPTDYYELRQAFVKFLEQAAEGGKVLLVIDALNQLDENHFAHNLDWLPWNLPKDLKLIASTLEGDCLDSLRRRNPAPREVVVGSLIEKERKEIVRQTLDAYRKTLDENQMRLLLEKKESDNPLYLIAACEEMRVYGDFDSVSDKLKSLADEVDSLFGQVLERIEQDHGKELVEDALVLLECSRHGLLESEMLELLAPDGEAQLPQAIWARFYRSIQFYLRPPGENGESLLDFFHHQLSKAVRQKYLRDKETEIAAHQRLAEYFRRKADPDEKGLWNGNYPRGLSELAYHLLEGKMYDRLFQTARDETFLQAQADAFVTEPVIQLDTLQKALTGAALIDEPAKMAEFVLVHARRLIAVRGESPLNALRAGSLERAWELANLNEIDSCLLWHLLVTWELKDAGKMVNALATMQRLGRKKLPRLAYWQSEYAGTLFSKVFEVAIEFIDLHQAGLLDDDGLLALIKELVRSGKIDFAINTVRFISSGQGAAAALTEIALGQVKAGDRTAGRKSFSEAREAARKVRGEWDQAFVLLKIGLAQAQAGHYLGSVKTLVMARRLAAKVEGGLNALYDLGIKPIIQGNDDTPYESFAETIQVARNLSSEADKASTLLEIAKAQDRGGDSKAARDTLAIMLEPSGQVENEDHRENALCAISIIQAETGDFESALKTARQIGSEYLRQGVLSQIAVVQSGIGNVVSALNTLTEALQTAQLIQYETTKVWALTNIAVIKGKMAMAKSHNNFAVPLEVANNIKDDWERAGALLIIVQAKASMGDFVGAFNIASEISNDEWRASALSTIAGAEAQAGEFDAALETTQQISNARHRASALSEIAKAQVAIGQFEESLKTVQEISYEDSRAIALSKIAEAQAAGGKVERALKTVRAINDEERRAFALSEVAKVQAKAGSIEEADRTFEDAFKIAQGISYRYRTWALSRIAQAQATVGKYKEAINTANEISDERDRAMAFTGIANAQATAGKDEESIKTTQLILIDSDEAISQVAEVFASNGAKDSFKQLLAPTSYHISASYKMCGLLAQLYADDEEAIDKIVALVMS